jgi:hypothetical protein
MTPRSAGPGFAGVHWDSVFSWKHARGGERDPLCWLLLLLLLASRPPVPGSGAAPSLRALLQPRGHGLAASSARAGPPFYTVLDGRRVPISDRLIARIESRRGRRRAVVRVKSFAGSVMPRPVRLIPEWSTIQRWY